MGRGDRPRLSPGWNVALAGALTAAVMAAVGPGSSEAGVPAAPGPVAFVSR